MSGYGRHSRWHWASGLPTDQLHSQTKLDSKRLLYDCASVLHFRMQQHLKQNTVSDKRTKQLAIAEGGGWGAVTSVSSLDVVASRVIKDGSCEPGWRLIS